MKERQDSIAARIAGTIAGGVRRRQQDRTPRALVYDATGEPRVVPAGSDAQAALIAAAELLVDEVLAEDGGAEPEDEAAETEDEAAGDVEAAAADLHPAAGDLHPAAADLHPAAGDLEAAPGDPPPDPGDAARAPDEPADHE
jgi:hypothetical protein